MSRVSKVSIKYQRKNVTVRQGSPVILLIKKVWETESINLADGSTLSQLEKYILFLFLEFLDLLFNISIYFS